MPKPRKQLVDLSKTPFYHCISRCVRRGYLCGEDKYSGQNYSHRKQWVVDLIKQLSSIYAIDTCAYAVMSNHYHTVIRIDEARAKSWSDNEVIERWTSLFNTPYLIKKYLEAENQHKQLSPAIQQEVKNIIKRWRKRLANISWFFRCLNEDIAREANVEDNCTGRFWEGRFKSQALQSDQDLLSCMAYVDLNPVRAGIAQSLETSDFTSIQERLIEAAKTKLAIKEELQRETKLPQPSFLMPFIGSEHQDKVTLGINYNVVDYFELVDWTGRIARDDKRGAIASHKPHVLDQLFLDTHEWNTLVALHKTVKKPPRRGRIKLAGC